MATTSSSSRRHFASIDSTNSAARAWARDQSTLAPHGAVVSADEQTAGRGRRGRDWVSPTGKGVYLSIVWRPKMSPAQVGQLTIITALGAARALEQISEKRIETKWPNDLLLNRKKIGGILCESEIHNGNIEFLIAGVGLNANLEQTDLPERPVFPATSLLLETQRHWPIEALQDATVNALHHEYARHERGEWHAQRGEFIARCAIIGEVVKISDGGSEYSGIATGIDDGGLLIVQTADGTQRVVSGDVSFYN